MNETHLLREPEHRAGALALGEKGTHMELETKRKADERPAQRDVCLLLPQERHLNRLPSANELVELAKVSLGPLHGPLAVEEQAAVQQKLPVACAHLLRGGLELACQLSVVHLEGAWSGERRVGVCRRVRRVGADDEALTKHAGVPLGEGHALIELCLQAQQAMRHLIGLFREEGSVVVSACMHCRSSVAIAFQLADGEPRALW